MEFSEFWWILGILVKYVTVCKNLNEICDCLQEIGPN
jgi:hypothetical protein